MKRLPDLITEAEGCATYAEYISNAGPPENAAQEIRGMTQAILAVYHQLAALTIVLNGVGKGNFSL